MHNADEAALFSAKANKGLCSHAYIVDGAAGISLSVNTAEMRIKVEALMKRLLSIDGVQSAQILQGKR